MRDRSEFIQYEGTICAKVQHQETMAFENTETLHCGWSAEGKMAKSETKLEV